LNRLQTRYCHALLLISIVPLAVMSFLIIRFNSDALAEQSERELTGLATGLAGEIDAYLFGLLNDAKVIASLPDIVSMDPARQELLLRELFRLNYGFAQIVTTDRSGQMLATARPMELRSIASVASFQRAVNGGEQSWVVATAVFGEGRDLHIHTPIVQADGSIVGVVGSPVPLSSMAGAIERVSIGIAGESFVLDENGLVLFHPRRSAAESQTNYTNWIYREDGSPPLTPGVAHYLLEGVETVAGYAPLTNRFGWTVVVERPLAEMTAPASRGRNLALLGVAATTLLSLLAAYSLSQTLTRPVTTLIQAVTAGVDKAPLPATTAVPEIDALINAFATMRSELVAQKAAVASYRAAVAATDEGVALLDSSHRYLFANQAYAQMHGYADGEALNGRSWQIAYTSTEFAHIEQNALPLLQGNSQWRGELQGKRRDGTLFDQAAVMVPGARGGLVLLLHDVTSRKSGEEAAWQTQKLESLGVLVGGIAHDFNNLLTGMLGHATMAKARLSPNSAAYDSIHNAVLSAERAAELTKQLLAYTGRGRFEMHPLDLNKLILENGRLLETAIPNHTELLLDLLPNLSRIKGDPSQLQQVLMNLVINAAEATEATGGSVLVKTSEQPMNRAQLAALAFGGETLLPGLYVSLVVRDNGIGMVPETLARIFDPFFSTKAKGYGLGLSATLGIIRTHRGALAVESKPGHGTEFSIYFPVTREQVSEMQDEQNRIPALQGTVLVVDDEEAVRRVAHDILTQTGMRVLQAVNGQQGVELFGVHHRELTAVLLDLRMPIMDGRTAYDEMMKIDPSVKVIISSGYSDAEVKEYFVNQTDVLFLNKPYRFEGLINKMRELLAE
jgi:PAS domain S-box-containing protein